MLFFEDKEKGIVNVQELTQTLLERKCGYTRKRIIEKNNKNIWFVCGLVKDNKLFQYLPKADCRWKVWPCFQIELWTNTRRTLLHREHIERKSTCTPIDRDIPNPRKKNKGKMIIIIGIQFQLISVWSKIIMFNSTVKETKSRWNKGPWIKQEKMTIDWQG